MLVILRRSLRGERKDSCGRWNAACINSQLLLFRASRAMPSRSRTQKCWRRPRRSCSNSINATRCATSGGLKVSTVQAGRVGFWISKILIASSSVRLKVVCWDSATQQRNLSLLFSLSLFRIALLSFRVRYALLLHNPLTYGCMFCSFLATMFDFLVLIPPFSFWLWVPLFLVQCFYRLLQYTIFFVVSTAQLNVSR